MGIRENVAARGGNLDKVKQSQHELDVLTGKPFEEDFMPGQEAPTSVIAPFTASITGPAVSPSVNYTYFAKAIRVIDGDTAVLDVDLGFQVHYACHVRFMHYNAPELHGPNPDAGAKAKGELTLLLEGKSLLIVSNRDFSQTFARYLATVYVLDASQAISVAEHMTRKGFNVKQGD
ncbi:hypothetical protein UFOVP142_21 [uncultured Caudovirales phage]|uniref:TNase-like domain-containing protein n=1 Tax=uncultured Caudovirales phage TaxID=2100421 RepID=A0A6J7XL05_9CAUD|nr:hypothetical protein UFOVP142_21 [uncultured Caudovirales phage]